MDLPVAITPFTHQLPWETTIQGSPVTEVRFDFELVNQRLINNTRLGQYQNIGVSASPTFTVDIAIAVHRFSFNFVPPQFGIDAIEQFIAALCRYLVNKDVIPATPTDIPPPAGLEWGLTDQVVDYMDSGGPVVPRPRGLFAAFRVLPGSEYGTATEEVGIYRGESPPV